MTLLVQQAAVLCAATGVLTGVAVASRTGDVRQGLAMLLDFLLAAGLLRLSASTSWSALLTTAALVLLRTLLVHTGPQATGAGRREGRTPSRGGVPRLRTGAS